MCTTISKWQFSGGTAIFYGDSCGHSARGLCFSTGAYIDRQDLFVVAACSD